MTVPPRSAPVLPPAYTASVGRRRIRRSCRLPPSPPSAEGPWSLILCGVGPGHGCDDRLNPPSICRSATQSGWRRRAGCGRWAPRAMPTTTRSRRASTASTRPSSSTAGGRGAVRSKSRWGPPSGWTGGTTGACTARPTTCRRRSMSSCGGNGSERSPGMLFPRPSTEMARGEDGRGAAHSRKLYRFLYTRFCAVIAWTLLQAPRSPKNLGQYIFRTEYRRRRRRSFDQPDDLGRVGNHREMA